MERIPMTTGELYNLACYQSLRAGALDRPGPGADREEPEAAATAAVETLKKAIDAGYRDLAPMKADTDLDPLRSRPDFPLLVVGLALPARPFAR